MQDMKNQTLVSNELVSPFFQKGLQHCLYLLKIFEVVRLPRIDHIQVIFYLLFSISFFVKLQ